MRGKCVDTFLVVLVRVGGGGIKFSQNTHIKLLYLNGEEVNANEIGALMNKARARGWAQTQKIGGPIVFEKGGDTITVRLLAGHVGIQSAKVRARRVNHHIKSTTQYDEGQYGTIVNWLEW